MELLIILLWFVMLVVVPILLVITAYVGYRSSESPFTTIAGAIFGIILHILAVSFSFFPVFLLFYAGAHTKPVGQAIGLLPGLAVLGVEILYGFAAFSYCSILYGRKRLWPLPVSETA